MAFQTKKSRFAIVEEVTEGTLVAPSAGTQFIAIQDGFSLELGFEQLTNEELTGSIGASKDVVGFETPSGEGNHYLKHSGVEGQAPNYGLLIEMALGEKTTQSTERTLTTGSTAGTSSARAVLELAAGGSDYARGRAMLIKDGVNGYEIRNTHSVSSNSVTLAQNLSGAPASGVTLGKHVAYEPGESHPTASVWDYRGNGGAVQAAGGMRVTEMGIEFPAGEFINMSFSLEGIKNHFNPIILAATDTKLDFNETGPTLRAATIAAGVYKDPHELAAAIETAMDAVATDNITVSYSDSTGKFTISTAGSLLELLWNTGANTANTIGDKIGFSTAADDTGALTYTSDNAQTLSSPYTPTFDSSNPLVAKSNEVMLGDFDDISCFSAQSVSFSVSNTKADVLAVCSSSGKDSSLVTGREVTAEIVANLVQYDADKFKRLRAGDNIMFTYNAGEMSGGNWVAGKCVNVHMPTATIVALTMDDADGVVVMNLSLKAYVDSSLGEVYVNFV